MRPKLKVGLKKSDILIEIVTLLVIVFYIVIGIYAWVKLPETIPIHFNSAGEIDGYGSKINLLILLPVIAAFYIVFTILSRFPHIYNYIVEINSDNAQVQYEYATRMIRLLKCELVILFTYIEVTMIRSAIEKVSGLGVLFLPITLLVVFGTLGYYIYKSLKAA